MALNRVVLSDEASDYFAEFLSTATDAIDVTNVATTLAMVSHVTGQIAYMAAQNGIPQAEIRTMINSNLQIGTMEAEEFVLSEIRRRAN